MKKNVESVDGFSRCILQRSGRPGMSVPRSGVNIHACHSPAFIFARLTWILFLKQTISRMPEAARQSIMTGMMSEPKINFNFTCVAPTVLRMLESLGPR
jgi:hypothetical protein